MKLRGYSDLQEWSFSSLVKAICFSPWECGGDVNPWRLRFVYTWHDGPVWVLEIGPWWFAVGNCLGD